MCGDVRIDGVTRVTVACLRALIPSADGIGASWLGRNRNGETGASVGPLA